MPVTIPDTQLKGPSLKEQYVSPEQNIANHVQVGEFAKDMAITAALTTGSGTVGGLVGGQWGGFVAGKVGFLVGMYRHWKKTHGRQQHIENTLDKVHEALDPETLKRETEKEQVILKELEELEKKLAERKVAHASSVTTRRETGAQHQR